MFCDGSVAKSRLDGITKSSLAGEVGRIVVLIPERDFGLIEVVHGRMTSGYVEEMAIRRAIEKCQEVGMSDNQFMIYSDSDEAIRNVASPNVRRIEHEAKRKGLHLADVFLDRIMRRCSYLRRTEGIVKARKPPTSRQKEIERLMNAERLEFRLSENPIYLGIRAQLRKESNNLQGMGKDNS